MLRAGTLNRRITIQRHSEERDEIGQPIPGGASWGDFVTVSANVRYLNGTETLKSDAPVSVARASIRIRYRTDIDASMRVIHGDRVLEIRAVLPDETGREYVDLVCETGGQGG
jgi:SPP1 family predicted phage head-tail adaptor